MVPYAFHSLWKINTLTGYSSLSFSLSLSQRLDKPYSKGLILWLPPSHNQTIAIQNIIYLKMIKLTRQYRRGAQNEIQVEVGLLLTLHITRWA